MKEIKKVVDIELSLYYNIVCVRYIVLKSTKMNTNMREWLSGGVSPCQGEGRGFESRLALNKKTGKLVKFSFPVFLFLKIMCTASFYFYKHRLTAIVFYIEKYYVD